MLSLVVSYSTAHSLFIDCGIAITAGDVTDNTQSVVDVMISLLL